jgi:hypothetical protein
VLREAAGFYQLDHAAQSPTPTERRKHLTAVKIAAARLSAKRESGKWAKRLASAIRAVATDRGAETLLVKALAEGTGERLGKLPALLGELDALAAFAGVPEGAMSRAARFEADWLPRIRVLAVLKVEALAPTASGWPDPALPPLVLRLAPLWKRVTGYSLVAMSNGEQHRFGEWVRGVVQCAGLPSPPVWSVWDVSELQKLEK